MWFTKYIPSNTKYMNTINELTKSLEEIGIENIDYILVLEKGKYHVGDVVNIGKYNMEVKEKEYKIVVV